MSDLEDDDVPQLSSHALAALQEFYAEKNQCGGDKYNVGRIEENWVSKCIPYIIGNIDEEPVLDLVWCLSISHLISKTLSPVNRELITYLGN